MSCFSTEIRYEGRYGECRVSGAALPGFDTAKDRGCQLPNSWSLASGINFAPLFAGFRQPLPTSEPLSTGGAVTAHCSRFGIGPRCVSNSKYKQARRQLIQPHMTQKPMLRGLVENPPPPRLILKRLNLIKRVQMVIFCYYPG